MTYSTARLKIAQTSENMVSFSRSAASSQRLPLRRNTKSAFRRNSPTFWIGVSMSCLVIVYVIVVIIVTRMHRPSATVASDILAYPQTLKEKLQQAKDTKKEHKNANKNKRKEEIIPISPQILPDHKEPGKRDDGKVLGHIKPHVLLQHERDAPLVEGEGAPKHHPTPNNILKAFLEETDFEEWERKPLPARTNAQADKLEQVSYPRLYSCSKLTQQFPVDDTPTERDPFLPWIHDVFPTADGKYIQFVAQNKRRCKTGSQEQDIMMFMQPQVALFQHVPVKRIKDGSETRYQLVPYEEADSDGMTARFVCRFKPSMEETVSVHNIDYDWTSYRKRYKTGFKKDDGGIKSIHTTQLLFRCPVPEHLQETVRTGASVKDDWASLFVDLIPIRTPPRYGSPTQFLAPWYQEHQSTNSVFDPVSEWGDKNVMPRIEDSGRWENIPICKPSLMTYEDQKVEDLPAVNAVIPKKHKLVSCIWASAGYTTRGERFAVNDGQRRLLEWLTHNRLIGFDHFYLYDNTGAFRNDTSLKPIADLFPGEVTYIQWPSKVCNNRPNNVDSPGERSSQYAAESSCRLRFGPHVEWIGQFDIDEYFVPMGEHKTALSLLEKLDKEDTRIISFGSWRAWPRWAHISPPVPINDRSICWHDKPCFDLQIPMDRTMLQAYNCDRQLPGKKSQVMPAEKQFYKADYVLQHFIHYSAATVLSEKNKTEYEKEGFTWSFRGFPDKRQRFGDEVTEGLMIHTKAVAHQDTVDWENVCHIDNLKKPKRQQGLCRLGVPWPKDPGLAQSNATDEGWAYNCYVNEKVESYFVPRLDEALKERFHIFDPK